MATARNLPDLSDPRKRDIAYSAERIVPAQDPWRLWAFQTALCLAVLAVYGQVVRYPFVPWDDNLMVAQNPYLHPPSFAHVAYFWRHAYYGLWAPLTYTLYSGLAALTPSGVSPAIFHAANLALHAGAALVLFALLRRLEISDTGAFVGALLFAVHPLQAEPVSWVGGMDTVLCTLFSLLAILEFVRLAEARDSGASSRRLLARYVIATFWYLLALLAKPAAVSVPLIAGVIFWFLVYRPSARRDTLWWLLPWLLIGGLWVRLTQGAQPLPPQVHTALWQRPLVAGDALAFYLAKLVVPVRLAVDYGRTPQLIIHQWWGYATWLLPAAAGAGAWALRRRFPPLGAGFLVMAAALLPVLGLVPFGFQTYSTVGDRYMYLAMVGPAIALATLLPRLPARAFGAVFALLLVFATLSGIQSRVWRDPKTLFEHSLAICPNCPNIEFHLAHIYDREGDAADATAHYQRALDLVAHDPAERARPGFSRYGANYVSMGQAQARIGNINAAIADYEQAQQIDPSLSRAYFELGLILAQRGNTVAAADQWKQELAIEPTDKDARFDLGVALITIGRYKEAAGQLGAVVNARPAVSGKMLAAARHLLTVAQDRERGRP